MALLGHRLRHFHLARAILRAVSSLSSCSRDRLYSRSSSSASTSLTLLVRKAAASTCEVWRHLDALDEVHATQNHHKQCWNA